MASIVEICNMALSEVGSGPIVSLNDATTEAEQCRIHYSTARDKVLGEREWTFAVTRRELAKSATDPAYGHPNQFQLPSDCIRVLQCHSSSDVEPQSAPNSTDWSKEGPFVISDSDGIWCRYLRRVEDPNEFSAGFISALSFYLASRLAIPLQQNRGLRTELLQIYELELRKAAAVDGLQGRNKTVRFSRLDSVRRL